MTDDRPSADELKDQQLDQEQAEREALAAASTEADADRHRRRADKARYLVEKLEERAQADCEAGRDQG